MVLNRERPEIDSKKQPLDVKEKYLEKFIYFKKILENSDTLAQTSQHILHIPLFQNILSISFILIKKICMRFDVLP